MSLEARRERQKRWRESARGRAKLQAKYKARKRLLDQIKRKRGCRVCGEKNPKALSFIPRGTQRIAFTPQLKNTTRSLDDWKEVIAACDIYCRNCLAKRRRLAGSGVKKKGQDHPQNRRKPSVNIAEGQVCEVCGGAIKASTKGPKTKPRKRFCSDRCRLLAWAVRELDVLEIKP